MRIEHEDNSVGSLVHVHHSCVQHRQRASATTWQKRKPESAQVDISSLRPCEAHRQETGMHEQHSPSSTKAVDGTKSSALDTTTDTTRTSHSDSRPHVHMHIFSVRLTCILIRGQTGDGVLQAATFGQSTNTSLGKPTVDHIPDLFKESDQPTVHLKVMQSSQLRALFTSWKMTKPGERRGRGHSRRGTEAGK